MKSVENPSQDDKEWERVRVAAFWSYHITRQQWREFFLTQNPSFFYETIDKLHPKIVCGILGEKVFLKTWPELRLEAWEKAEPHSTFARRLRQWDAYWSLKKIGAPGLEPRIDFNKLPRRRKEFLIEALRHPGLSVYAISKRLGMTYCRAHEHMTKLSTQGFLTSMERVREGRAQRILGPVSLDKRQPEFKPDISKYLSGAEKRREMTKKILEQNSGGRKISM